MVDEIQMEPFEHIATELQEPQREAAFGRVHKGGTAVGRPSFVEPLVAM